MRVICCVCGLKLQDVESTSEMADAVSHGLCETCFHSMKAQLGMTLDEYIEGIPAPVAVLNTDGDITHLNARALAHEVPFPGSATRQEHLLIFDCQYARQETGCGQHLCCSGCTIRHSVAKTQQTGLPQRDVPAVQHHSMDSTQQADVFITTMKKGGIVHLSIQPKRMER